MATDPVSEQAPLRPDAFRSAMRTWASGVTIISAQHEGQVHGMTVSAFSSVSASPPLVLVCANQASMTHSFIAECGAFAVNVLAAGQAELSRRFASVEGLARFDGVDWVEGPLGSPFLSGALAQFECRVRSSYPEGTHTIYVGEVVGAKVNEGEPLLYFNGAYTELKS